MSFVESTQSTQIRHDWSKQEVQALFDLSFNDPKSIWLKSGILLTRSSIAEKKLERL